MYNLIAIDPGLSGVKINKKGKKSGSNTGLAAFYNGKLIATKSINLGICDTFQFKSIALMEGIRLFENSCYTAEMILEGNDWIHIVEQGFYQGKANINHLKLMGVLDHRLRNVSTISPLSVKKLVTGSGKADKGQVLNAVLGRLSRKERLLVNNLDEDIVDAVAIGLAYIIREKQHVK